MRFHYTVRVKRMEVYNDKVIATIQLPDARFTAQIDELHIPGDELFLNEQIEVIITDVNNTDTDNDK